MAALEQSAPSSRKRSATYTQHSDDMRACVVHLRARGDSWSQVIATTGMPFITARSFVQTARAIAMRSTHTSDTRATLHHTPVINDAVKRLIADVQSAGHTLRLQDIRDALDVTLLDAPLQLCIQTLWNALHAAGFTTKALSKHAQHTRHEGESSYVVHRDSTDSACQHSHFHRRVAILLLHHTHTRKGSQGHASRHSHSADTQA
jgi:hypothetical protein